VTTGLPGARSTGDTVTDQWTPGQRLDGGIDRVQHLLLEVVQRRRADRSVETVKTQHDPAATTSAGMTQHPARAGVAPVTAVTDHGRIAAITAIATMTTDA
jgi:hypothetical protein